MKTEYIDIIISGSFNPPHNGHFRICDKAIEFVKEKEKSEDVRLFFIPIIYSETGRALAAYEHRIEMARLGAISHPGVIVLDLEGKLCQAQSNLDRYKIFTTLKTNARTNVIYFSLIKFHLRANY